jgi:hypothetical protein
MDIADNDCGEESIQLQPGTTAFPLLAEARHDKKFTAELPA